METTLAIISDLEKNHVLRRYALSGSMAFLFYTEPLLTYDLEVICLPRGGNIELATIYDYLGAKGCDEGKEHVMIAALPVRFIAATSELSIDALRHSVEQDYKGVKTRVVSYEHLLALVLEENKSTASARIIRAVSQRTPDRERLTEILTRHDLLERYRAMGL